MMRVKSVATYAGAKAQLIMILTLAALAGCGGNRIHPATGAAIKKQEVEEGRKTMCRRAESRPIG
jgi:hypothetical protein